MNKRSVVVSILIATTVLILILPKANTQVTFTRDWAGKRFISPDFSSIGGDCGINSKSLLATCHLLINEIKQWIACESKIDTDNSLPQVLQRIDKM